MKRLGLALFLLTGGNTFAGGMGAPVYPSPVTTLVIGDIRIVATNDGLKGMKGTALVWMNPQVLSRSLKQGPGQWITAIGIINAPQSLPNASKNGGGFPELFSHSFENSIVVDPLSGKVLADITGSIVNIRGNVAQYAEFQTPPFTPVTPFAILTGFNTETLSTEIKKFVGAEYFPSSCLKLVRTSEDLLATDASVSLIRYSIPLPLNKPQTSRINVDLETDACHLLFRLDLVRSRLTLLKYELLK